MKERPILFSSPMVKAILAGTKSQTRRIVKAQPFKEDGVIYTNWPGGFDDAPRWCPYGVVGDRLWMRESCWLKTIDGCDEEWQFGELVQHDWSEFVGSRTGCVPPEPDEPPHVWYAADGSLPKLDACYGHWTRRNSIFMPRWASRITLEVTDVRVERLNDISEDDARAEGVANCSVTPYIGNGKREMLLTAGHARDAFRDLWGSINGKRAPWSSNPFVWVVAFQRLP